MATVVIPSVDAVLLVLDALLAHPHGPLIFAFVVGSSIAIASSSAR